MNINRDYLIVNDVKKSNVKLDNGSIFFYITDKNTQNIFVNLVINVSKNDLIQKYANIENAEDYTLTMNIVKPSNTYKAIEGKLHDKENAIFEFDLNEDCCDEIGTYRCELLTKCNINDHEEITTSNKLTYKVKSSVLNDLDEIQEAPEYPLVIQLFDKLSDIEQYEEDRRANELARQLAEEQRQTRFDALDSDMVDKITAMDDKMVDVENRVSAKEQAVDKLINDTKADIDNYKVAKDQEIDEYKTAKDTEINNAITNQDNKIDTAISEQNDRISNAIATQDNKIDTAINAQNDRITVVENNDVAQDNRLDVLENKDVLHESRLDAIEVKNQQQDNRLDIVENKNTQQDNRLNDIEAKNVEQDNRLDDIEAIDVAQNSRLDAIEIKNQQQDDRLLDIEKVNKRQDMDLKCLFVESKNNMIDVTEEGNSIYLQNSTIGYTLIDEIKGNTLVNCNKEPNKELVLNSNINTSGDNNITITEGVDGGLVDVALEGNTLVNVSKTKDSTAITKSYTVEDSGNHIVLQGDVDGSCRPVVTGNTLVNLIVSEHINDNDALSDFNLSYVKPNTVHTLICDLSISGDYSTIEFGFLDETFNMWRGKGVNNALVQGFNVVTVTSEDRANGFRVRIDNEVNAKIVVKNAILLEGDYTNKPIPGYFEGLQSSFEDNLVPENILGEKITDTENKVEYSLTKNIKPNTIYTIYLVGENMVYCGFQKNSTWVKYKAPSQGIQTITTDDNIDINKFSVHASGNIRLYACILVEGDHTNFDFLDYDLTKVGKYKVDYKSTQEDGTVGSTKTLYLNSPLLEGDTIEEKDDGIYHVHRSEELVLDGNADEKITIYPIRKDGFTSFLLNIPEVSFIDTKFTNVICDVLPSDSKKNYSSCTTPNIYKWIDASADFVGVLEGNNVNVRQWLQQNPATVVYQLAEPQYELIEQSDLVIPSYSNGHLDFNTAVPIEKVEFKPFSEELTYLYANTQYTVQFISYEAITADITLGGTELLAQSIVKGLNRISITTPATLTDNKLVMSGVGLNIEEVVVTEATDQDFGYFEGMKSVGECEDLEVVSSDSDGTLSNTQTLTHEPLRAVGDAKDKYVLIDGKWYIERNCGYRNGYTSCDNSWSNDTLTNKGLKLFKLDGSIEEFDDMNTLRKVKSNKFKCVQYGYMDGRFNVPFLAYITENGNLWVSADINYTQQDMLNYINDCQFVYELQTPTYEPIDYNPFEVYSEITHISNNSTIPCNMTIKNTGYNCLLKPSTTYTVSSNLGLNVVTTPSSLTEDCLRFYDTDTSTVTTMKNVTILEGDYTTGKPLPSHFAGIESAFEQEYDETVGKYKVKIRVQNEDASKENYIEFYINEPLRGTDAAKDRVFIKDDKVVVQRNCGIRPYEDGDFGTYLTDKVNTVYQLAEPTYEEVEYNDTKLFIESFKNSTLLYNSNVPVTSTVHYSYSVPIVDTVAQTANISDQQDSMIIDLATQCAVMEIMLM